MRRMTRVALALALLPLGAVSLEAATGAADEPADNQVTVSNTYWTAVQVYAVDSAGGKHFLGRVSPARFELFAIPAQVSELGEFRITVYPQDLDARSPRPLNGITTGALELGDEESVVIVLARDLAASTVFRDRG